MRKSLSTCRPHSTPQENYQCSIGGCYADCAHPSLVHLVQYDVRQLLQTARVLQPAQQHSYICREQYEYQSELKGAVVRAPVVQ
jgi:hypothetical protein